MPDFLTALLCCLAVSSLTAFWRHLLSGAVPPPSSSAAAAAPCLGSFANYFAKMKRQLPPLPLPLPPSLLGYLQDMRKHSAATEAADIAEHLPSCKCCTPCVCLWPRAFEKWRPACSFLITYPSLLFPSPHPFSKLSPVLNVLALRLVLVSHFSAVCSLSVCSPSRGAQAKQQRNHLLQLI